MLKTYKKNDSGRDLVVGDIHGHFTELQKALNSLGFDASKDRLFSVGDMVDRGPECRMVLDWLDKPWFIPVRGNHDDYVCRFDSCDLDNWIYNGGSWFLGLPFDEQREYAARFRDLPIAIEVETDYGLIGIVHADCVTESWFDLQYGLCGGRDGKDLKLLKNSCMWSRGRIEQHDTSGVADIRAVICGHTPLRKPVVLGNVYHIDTMGWRPQDDGYFTFIDLATLECWPVSQQRLGWND